MKIFLTVALVLVWLGVMQANLGWVGTETSRLQAREGISSDEAFRRVIWRTILFACLYTGTALYFGWRIWR
jgi:hypothetical protein